MNITNYNENFEKILKIIDNVEKSCTLGKQLEIQDLKHVCNQYQYQVAQFLTEIKNNKEHVIKVIKRPITGISRSKRGAINIVGRFANVLFGICDDKDANYFYNKIRDFEESKFKTAQLLDSQTQILKSIVSNVNSSLIELASNQEKLTEKYNYLNSELEAEKIEIGILKFKVALEEQITLLNLILIQYSFETENLENIINAAIHGSIHSSLLDSQTLKEQLKEIESQLPVGATIPIDLDKSGLSELLGLASVSIVYLDEILMFIMEIPILDNFEFILYKTIPLPIKLQNNTYTVIAPSADYIAVDKSRLYYVELSTVQISQCKRTMDRLICTHEQQIFHADGSCEISVFRRPDILPDSCIVKYVSFSTNIWHRLEGTNTWLFITNIENIIIKCKNMSEPIEIRINGTGIFKLDINCEANTDDGTILIPKRKIVSRIYKDFIPKLNNSIISEFQLNIPKFTAENLLTMKNSKKVKHNLMHLIENSKSLNELHTEFNEKIVDNKEQMPTQYFYIIIMIAVISISLLGVKYVLEIKKACSKPVNQIEPPIIKTHDDPTGESPLPRIV